MAVDSPTDGIRLPRQVLMTADPIGGVWTYALDLARAYAAFEVRVTLASMGAPLTDDQRRDVEALPNVDLHESTLRLEWMDDPWDDVARAGEWLLALADRTEPDLVHLNGYAHGALPWPVPALVVGHSCVCSWWRAVRGEDAPRAWDEYRARVAAGLRGAQMVVAPSAAMLSELVSCYGEDAVGDGRVILNGRDAVPGTVPLPAEKYSLILGAGRLWDDAKNLMTLARLAPRMPWPVFIAGDATAPAGAHGVDFAPPDVNLLGKLSGTEMREWMRRAAIYALPARYEPFGLTALEAALAGCALVLGDIPSLREIWRDAAIYVAPDDPEMLVARVRELAADVPRRTWMGERARRRATAYSARAMVASYLTAYSELLGKQATTEGTCVS